MSPESAAQQCERSLRMRLKAGTKEIHDVADMAMQALLFDETVATELSIQAYRYLLLQLYPLYCAMEEELRRHGEHAAVGPVHFPDELERARFLAEDLDHYYGPGQWRALLDTDITPGMTRYVARVREVGESCPELLLAHSYTRYLGDLSGGQILRRLLRKQYSLGDGERGLRFYCFDHVASVGELKALYIARLDGLALTDAQQSSQVEEAARIFQLNIDVFNAVADRFLAPARQQQKQEARVVETQGAHSLSSHSLGSVARVAYLTVGLSAAVLMLCPWFRGMVLKS